MMTLLIAIWSHTINLKQHWYVISSLCSVSPFAPFAPSLLFPGLGMADVVERARRVGARYGNCPLNSDARF